MRNDIVSSTLIKYLPLFYWSTDRHTRAILSNIMTVMLTQQETKENENLQKNFPSVENLEATEKATW